MPLTITEEMIKQDPFFEMGLKRVKELELKLLTANISIYQTFLR